MRSPTLLPALPTINGRDIDTCVQAGDCCSVTPKWKAMYRNTSRKRIKKKPPTIANSKPSERSIMPSRRSRIGFKIRALMRLKTTNRTTSTVRKSAGGTKLFMGLEMHGLKLLHSNAHARGMKSTTAKVAPHKDRVKRTGIESNQRGTPTLMASSPKRKGTIIIAASKYVSET